MQYLPPLLFGLLASAAMFCVVFVSLWVVQGSSGVKRLINIHSQTMSPFNPLTPGSGT